LKSHWLPALGLYKIASSRTTLNKKKAKSCDQGNSVSMVPPECTPRPASDLRDHLAGE